MNGLKKLFSPSALAATLASGMLLSSAIVAFAGTSVSTVTYQPTCPYGDQPFCQQFYLACDTTYYWCCTSANPHCDYGQPAQDCHQTVYGYCKVEP